MSKQINVRWGYQGSHAQGYIPPGIYSIDDDLVKDVADHLLEIGRAALVTGDEPAPRRAIDRDTAGNAIYLETGSPDSPADQFVEVYNQPANRRSAPDEETVPVGEIMADNVDSDPWEGMTVPMLRTYATEIGVDVTGLNSRDGLIQAIEAHLEGLEAQLDDDKEEIVNLQNMTVAELKAFAEDYGIDVTGLTKKAELIEAIGTEIDEGSAEG